MNNINTVNNVSKAQSLQTSDQDAANVRNVILALNNLIADQNNPTKLQAVVDAFSKVSPSLPGYQQLKEDVVSLESLGPKSDYTQSFSAMFACDLSTAYINAGYPLSSVIKTPQDKADLLSALQQAKATIEDLGPRPDPGIIDAEIAQAQIFCAATFPSLTADQLTQIRRDAAALAALGARPDPSILNQYFTQFESDLPNS